MSRRSFRHRHYPTDAFAAHAGNEVVRPEYAVERELSLIEAYESNLVDAIARGENMDPLLAKLRADEKQKNN